MRTLFIILLSTLPLISFSQSNIKTTWTGVYLGPNLGGIFNRAHLNAHQIALSSEAGQCNLNNSFSSAFLGGQLGAKKQLENHLVLGIEGDFSYHFNTSSFGQCDCDFEKTVYDQFKLSNRYQTSIRGQLGYALNNYHLLPFFSAGASFSDLGISYSNEVNQTYSRFTMEPGYILGGGIDWAYSEKFSLRLEYYYNQYNQLALEMPMIYDILDTSGQAKMNLSSNNIRVSLNYWFL